MPKYKLDKRQVSRQDTTSPKNIVKGGGTSITPSKGWVGALRSTLPINAAMFAQDLMGNKTPLKREDLNDEEVTALRKATRKANVRGNYGGVDYQDYDTGNSSLETNLSNPSARMGTTLGRANQVKKSNNSTTLTDTFDYNDDVNEEFSFGKLNKKVKAKGLYGAIRYTGGLMGSKDGEGAKVDINLGNLKRPTKYENETMKFKKGTKGIKKAVSGLQDIAVPEQGSYSNVLSSTSSLASAGSQFGLVGGLIGGAAGLGLGLLNKNKQDAANERAKTVNLDNKMNRAYAGDEDTTNQGMQRFKNGGKVKTKVIEIEGKKTPEIHTDKNFNVKNLGTTPHSKGGDKVEAEEGDIVFNTQNSLAKFNRIATHLQEGNKAALIKEKNKLPEDKGMKNQTGNKGVKKEKPFHYNSYGDKVYDEGYQVRTQPSTSSKRPTNPNKPLDVFGVRNFFTPKPFTPDARLADGSSMKAGDKPFESVKPTVKPTETFNAGYKLPGKVFPTTSSNKAPTGTKTTGKIVRKTTPISQALNTPTQVGKFTPNQNMDEPDLSDLKNRKTLDQVAESAKGMKPLDAISSPSKTTSPTSTSTPSSSGNKANTALQFAGVANNLFQGLKGERPVDETYVNPQTIKYNDRSQGLRNQSNGMMNAQISNARALSGGNVGNLRANASAARIDNLTRQGGIDEREQSRADAIQAQNVGIKNQAMEVNANRKDRYQDMNAANRAAKTAYIDQAASDISKYGQLKQQEGYLRSRDDKALAAENAGLKALNNTSQFKYGRDGTSTFDPYSGSSNLFNRRRTSKVKDIDLDPYDDDKKVRGVKSVKINKKYKLK